MGSYDNTLSCVNQLCDDTITYVIQDESIGFEEGIECMSIIDNVRNMLPVRLELCDSEEEYEMLIQETDRAMAELLSSIQRKK